jgi:hypothetical protein
VPRGEFWVPRHGRDGPRDVEDEADYLDGFAGAEGDKGSVGAVRDGFVGKLDHVEDALDHDNADHGAGGEGVEVDFGGVGYFVGSRY